MPKLWVCQHVLEGHCDGSDFLHGTCLRMWPRESDWSAIVPDKTFRPCCNKLKMPMLDVEIGPKEALDIIAHFQFDKSETLRVRAKRLFGFNPAEKQDFPMHAVPGATKTVWYKGD